LVESLENQCFYVAKEIASDGNPSYDFLNEEESLRIAKAIDEANN